MPTRFPTDLASSNLAQDKRSLVFQKCGTLPSRTMHDCMSRVLINYSVKYSTSHSSLGSGVGVAEIVIDTSHDSDGAAVAEEGA